MASEIVGTYIKAIEEAMRAVETLNTVDDYYRILNKQVKLPIRLHGIKNYSYYRLQERMQDIEKAFREIARETGVTEVVVPIMREPQLRLSFETVSIDSVSLKFRAYRVGTYDEIVAIAMEAMGTMVGEFPIAWRDGDSGEYRTSVGTVLITALLVDKNPWIAGALRKAIETVLSDYVRMRNEVMNFYTALRLIGAEDIK